MTRSIRLVLASWGLATLVLTGLFWARISHNQHEQDRDMCELTAVFLADPAPVEGPAGDRGRAIRAALLKYQASRDCPPRG